MPDLFKNKYRISTTRLQTWDYASEGMYFITICTANRRNYFGEIVVETQCIASPQLQLTEMGKICEIEWVKTPEIRPDMHLELGEFVVMPNHFHAILIIGENEFNRVDAMHCGGGDATHCVSTNRFAPQSKNLASVIRGFKSAVTTYARKNNIKFDWQPLFHDHIIRSEGEFNRIADYIAKNPAKWLQDKFFAK